MARPKLSARRLIRFYLPETVYTELLFIDTSLQDATGTLKYGAFSSLGTKLFQEHIEKKKASIRLASTGPGLEV